MVAMRSRSAQGIAPTDPEGLACFCSVSLVAGSDAYFYRIRLDEERAQFSAFVERRSIEATNSSIDNDAIR
jgi:hypothetical protein